MDEDDVKFIRRYAIKRAAVNWRAGGESHTFEAKAWLGVAVLCGADKGDLAAALSIIYDAVEEGVMMVRGDA